MFGSTIFFNTYRGIPILCCTTTVCNLVQLMPSAPIQFFQIYPYCTWKKNIFLQKKQKCYFAKRLTSV